MSNPEMMKAFSADPSNKLPGRQAGIKRGIKQTPKSERKPMKRTPMKRGKRPRPVSESQQEDIDVTTGVMAQRIWAAISEFGVFPCECKLVPGCELRDCSRVWPDPEEALEQCHPHHHEKRRKGPKANRRNVFKSRSRPSNIYVVYAACHDEIEENEPMWTGKAS